MRGHRGVVLDGHVARIVGEESQARVRLDVCSHRGRAVGGVRACGNGDSISAAWNVADVQRPDSGHCDVVRALSVRRFRVWLLGASSIAHQVPGGGSAEISTEVLVVAKVIWHRESVRTSLGSRCHQGLSTA